MAGINLIRVIREIRGQEKRQLMFNFLFVFSVFFDVAIKMKGENHDTRNKEQVVCVDKSHPHDRHSSTRYARI